MSFRTSTYGVNAINYAAKLISYIEELNKEKSQLGHLITNMNSLLNFAYRINQWGEILNIVPNLCQFEFEIRHLAEDDPKEIMQRFINMQKN